jgi:hypothetical protein
VRLDLRPLERDKPPLGAIYGGVLAICAVFAFSWSWLDLPRLVCPFREVTGLPCPTCGSTRMVEALLQADVLAAFTLNPLVFLVIAGIACWSAGSILRRALGWRRPSLVLGRGEQRWIRVAAIVVVLCGWGYVILAHGPSHS